MAGLKLKCKLCGYEFETEYNEKLCSACPLSKIKGKCGFAKCPNCFYENVIVENKKESIFRKILERLKWM